MSGVNLLRRFDGCDRWLKRKASVLVCSVLLLRSNPPGDPVRVELPFIVIKEFDISVCGHDCLPRV